MAGITLAQAQEHLADALTQLTKARAAEQRTLTEGVNSRSISRRVDQLREEVKYWDEKTIELTNNRTGIRTRGVTSSYDR